MFYEKSVLRPKNSLVYLETFCMWHSYDNTVVRWEKPSSSKYCLILPKLSVIIYYHNYKILLKFERCGLLLLKVILTVPRHTSHPVYYLPKNWWVGDPLFENWWVTRYLFRIFCLKLLLKYRFSPLGLIINICQLTQCNCKNVYM